MARAPTRCEGALALSAEVRAAGGAIVRERDGEATILIVHRPRYDDWSLPKGKCLPDESAPDCARREVEEETGLECTLGAHLTDVKYRDQKGRAKTVAYFLMVPPEDAESQTAAFSANDEVDQLRWASAHEAETALSYAHDRKVARHALTQRP